MQRYDAFISYSHSTDSHLGSILQRALQRFAKPWWKLRALNLFRDETSLAAASDLTRVLYSALESSKYFVLLASPRAAQSKWCNKELEHWLKYHSSERLLLIMTGGAIVWDDKLQDFDRTTSTAIPPALFGVLKSEPFWLDLTWIQEGERASDRDPQFQQVVAKLAATLHGRSLEDISGEDVRQNRRTRRIALTASVIMAGLAIASVLAAWEATKSRDEATRQRDQAVFEQSRAMSTMVTAMTRAGELEGAALVANRMLRLYQDKSMGEPPVEAGLAAGQVLESWRLTGRLRGDLTGSCLSPDDNLAVVGHRDRTFHIVSLATIAPVAVGDGLDDEVAICAFSADGQAILLALANGTALLHDIRSNERTPAATLGLGRPNAVGIAPKGRRFVVGTDKGEAAVVELKGGQLDVGLAGFVIPTEKTPSEDKPAPPESVAWASLGFSSDERYAFAIPVLPKLYGLAPVLWDVQLRKNLSDEVREAYDFQFSPDATDLAVIDDNGLRIASLTSDNRRDVKFGNNGDERTNERGMEWWISYSPDGSRIAVNSKSSFSAGPPVRGIYDGATLQRLSGLDDGDYPAPPHEPSGRPIISSRGRFVALTGDRGTLYLIDGNSGRRIAEKYLGATSIDQVYFTDDEEQLIVIGSRLLRIYDLESRDFSKVVLSLQRGLAPASEGALFGVGLSAINAKSFAYETQRGLLQFGKIRPRRADFELTDDPERNLYIEAMAPTGRHVLIGRSWGKRPVRLFDIRSGRSLWSINNEDGGMQFAFTLDGQTVLLVTRHDVQWLALENGRVLRRILLERGKLSSSFSRIAFTRDRSQAVFTDGVFAYWIALGAAPTLRKVRLEGNYEDRRELSCYAISNHGEYLAEFTGVGIRVTDLQSGRIETDWTLEEAATGGPCAVLIGNDNTTIAIEGLGSAATSFSNRLDIYSTSQRAHIVTIPADKGAVLALLWSGDTRQNWTREAILETTFLSSLEYGVAVTENHGLLCRRSQIREYRTRIACFPGPGSKGLSAQILAQVLADAERSNGGLSRRNGGAAQLDPSTLSQVAQNSRSLVKDGSEPRPTNDRLLAEIAKAERLAVDPDNVADIGKALLAFVAASRLGADADRFDVSAVAAERASAMATLLPSWVVEEALSPNVNAPKGILSEVSHFFEWLANRLGWS